MILDLTRTTFRRLIQVYLVLMLLSAAVATYEVFAWESFSTEFDALTARYFGAPTDTHFFIFSALAMPALVAHIWAMFGLFRFKRWAPTLSWASLVVMILPSAIPSLSVTWYSSLSMVIEILGLGIFGMILLLAYSRDNGAHWFAAHRKEDPHG